MLEVWKKSPEPGDFDELANEFATRVTDLATFVPFRDLNSSQQKALSTLVEYDTHPAAQAFVTREIDEYKVLPKERYDARIQSIQKSISLVPQVLRPADRDTALRRLFYRLGHTYECQATFGMKDISYENPERMMVYMAAAINYIKADEAAGRVMSDFTFRTIECLMSLDLKTYAQLIASKFLGGDVSFVGSDDPAGMTIVEDLKRRATSLGDNVPGGGEVHLLSDSDMPQSSNN